MRKVWTPPWTWVFGAATAFGLSSFLQAYRLTSVNMKPGMSIATGKLLILNLALWYLPALLMPLIVSAARAFPLEAGRRARAIAVHVAGAVIFSFAHIIGLLGVRFLLWTNGGKYPAVPWSQYFQNRFFEQSESAALAGPIRPREETQRRPPDIEAASQTSRVARSVA